MEKKKKPENKTDFSSSNLKMFYTNANGLHNKIDELKLILESTPPVVNHCLS